MTRHCPVCRLRYPNDREHCFVDGHPLTEPTAWEPLERTGYRFVRALGSGRLWSTHEFHHVDSGARVAVKVLERDPSSEPGVRGRFLSAGRAAQRLDHPNLTRVIDVGEGPEGEVFWVTEYLDGEPLSALLSSGPVPRRGPLKILLHVARGLEHAHGAGLVHGDIDPRSIFILRSGVTKLCDLGLVPSVRRPDPNFRLPAQLTESDAFGSAYYPGVHLEPRDSMAADSYAFGVLIFELIAGRLPYDAKDALQLNVQRERLPVPTLRSVWADVPEPLEALTAGLMAKSASERPAIADAVLALTAIRAAAGFE